MAFQLSQLRIPNLTTDYSAETNAAASLAQALGNLPSDIRKERLNAQKQQLLGSLVSGTPDYNKVGMGLVALGDVQGGAAMLGLGQKQQQIDAGKATSELFAGRGAGAQAPLGQASAPGASAAPASLVQNESGGNWQAQNNAVGSGGAVGHFGRLQFGQARIQDAINAGALPPGTTPQAFMASPELQQRAEAWHFKDIDQKIQENGFDKLIGQSINGVPVTVDGLRAVAHLGGTEGMKKFVESGGRYNPRDRNGTSLMDYFSRHGGGGGQIQQAAPVQVAENEADVQRLEAQMPGYGGGAAVTSIAGDDPVKLRQEAERYQQSNPEAARQFLARAQAAEQAAGTRMAQAPAQPGTPQADIPAPGAAQAQGFAVPGSQNTLPPNDPVPHLTTQQLMGIATNPNVPESQRGIAKMVLDSRQKYSDENAPDKREMTRLQTQKLRREIEGEGAVPLTAEERTQFGIPADQAAYKTRSGEIKFGPAGTKIINEAQKGETKFEEELGKDQAKRFNGYIAEGDVAQNRLADIQTLREASRRLGSQGSQANFKSMIGPYAESLGIKIDGLSDIQLYESITNRLAPQLRAPGSGSTSDIEFKGFLRALGPLSNTPAAREMIFDTYEAASRNDLARADIASRLAQKEISRGQAEKEIRALPNPMEAFKKFREANPDLVGQAIKKSAEREAAEKRDPVKVASPEDARKLPSGTRIILPDGRTGQVP